MSHLSHLEIQWFDLIVEPQTQGMLQRQHKIPVEKDRNHHQIRQTANEYVQLSFFLSACVCVIGFVFRIRAHQCSEKFAMDQWIVLYSFLNINLTFVCKTPPYTFQNRKKTTTTTTAPKTDKNIDSVGTVLFVVNFCSFVRNFVRFLLVHLNAIAITLRHALYLALSVANIDFGLVFI